MTESKENSHKCLCEKCLFPNTENQWCCINMSEWFDSFQTYMTHPDKDGDCLCTTICCPFKFPFLLIFGLPCTLYNISRNKCNHTDNKNYLC